VHILHRGRSAGAFTLRFGCKATLADAANKQRGLEPSSGQRLTWDGRVALKLVVGASMAGQ
jgi:hypothetical protein